MSYVGKIAADPEAAIEFYLNEGWDGKGWLPYSVLVCGESMLRDKRTRRNNYDPDGEQDAQAFREAVLNKARERWLAGFYANPFTRKPRRRPCL